MLGDLADFIRIAGNDVAEAVLGVEPENVPVQADAVRSEVALPDFRLLVKGAAPKHFVVFPVVVVIVFYAELNVFCAQAARSQNTEMDRGVLLDRAERRAVELSL